MYKVGSSNGRKEQEKEIQEVVTNKINKEVEKQNDNMERIKLQKETEVYVCQFKDPNTLLYDIYPIIHKSDSCPKLESKDVSKRTYWNLVHSYSDDKHKFTLCPECWTKEEIEALEDKEQ